MNRISRTRYQKSRLSTASFRQRHSFVFSGEKGKWFVRRRDRPTTMKGVRFDSPVDRICCGTVKAAPC